MVNKAIFLVDDDKQQPFWKKETIKKVFPDYRIFEFTGSTVLPPSSKRFYASIKKKILSTSDIQEWYGIIDMLFEWTEIDVRRNIEEKNGGTILACQLADDEQIRNKVKELIIASALAESGSVPKGCYAYPYAGTGITEETWRKFRQFFNKEIAMNEAHLDEGHLAWESIEYSRSSEFFSILKHRIAHLFLSMDVDLQGIGVLRKQVAEGVIQNAVNTPKAYLRDVLNNKEKTCYRQKLADLHFLVAKVSEGKEEPFLECDGEPSGEPVRSTLSASKVSEDKAIDIIPEKKRNNDRVRLLWRALLNLSGLKANDAKLFENINPDTNSSIFEFMCLMDCKVDKKNTIRKDDVNNIMGYFEKIEGGNGWTVDGADPSPIKCFNDWFCALVDCLEKLRKGIKPDSNESENGRPET